MTVAANEPLDTPISVTAKIVQEIRFVRREGEATPAVVVYRMEPVGPGGAMQRTAAAVPQNLVDGAWEGQTRTLKAWLQAAVNLTNTE